MRKLTVAALASVLAITPVTGASATTGLGDTDAGIERNDNDFPWGLLGLLGLAGLLGLKRRDDDHHRTTTTGTTDRR